MFLEFLAVHLRVHEHARQIVRRVLAALGNELAAALEDLRHVFFDGALHAVGVQIRVPRAERRVHEVCPHRVVLGRDPHEAADHPRYDRLGDFVDQIALLTAGHAIEHVTHDRADRALVRGDALGREAGLEECLDAVVLGRVHPDEHRPRELEREDVRQRGDASEFGGVRAPVAADRVDVIRPRDRPEPWLARELGEALGPVDRALVAQALEQLVRRSPLPQLTLGDEDLVEIDVAGIAANRRHLRPPGVVA